jgi:hypothetical protein
MQTVQLTSPRPGYSECEWHSRGLKCLALRETADGFSASRDCSESTTDNIFT